MFGECRFLGKFLFDRFLVFSELSIEFPFGLPDVRFIHSRVNPSGVGRVTPSEKRPRVLIGNLERSAKRYKDPVMWVWLVFSSPPERKQF